MTADKKIFKIGIYDRYLSTAGGGERYSCKIAEILSGDVRYKVDMITDLFADLDVVGSKLNLNLEKVDLKVFPFLSVEYAKKITEAYDIFINTTYLSALPSYARRNLYLCYFPTPFDVDFTFIHRLALLFFRYPAIWLYKLGDRLLEGFKGIEVTGGLYDLKRFMLHRGSFTSGKADIIYEFGDPVNTNKKETPSNEIWVGLKNPVSLGVEHINCKVELFRVDVSGNASETVFSDEMIIGSGTKKILSINTKTKEKSKFLLSVSSDTFTAGPGNSAGADTRNLGIVLYNEQRINFLKKFLLKILGFIPLFLVAYPKNLGFLNSYDRIISISGYSEKWIKKLWKKESTILYPPVDTESFAPVKKEKIILSVGRFFPQHHNKKQFEMLKQFMELYNNRNDIFGDYTLVLAGGVENKKEHLEYVEKIRNLAGSYPVKILTNIRWEELKDIFGKSLIFWHAAGMDEDENSNPEKFEHFGITTVEAMASGCICVVINKGGQPEIIDEGSNGFLFDSWQQLKEKTVDICTGKVDIASISENAVKSSNNFSSEKFKEKLEELINDEIDSI
jgi:glycosyltransferase involved in cell wall biosynthesis